MAFWVTWQCRIAWQKILYKKLYVKKLKITFLILYEMSSETVQCISKNKTNTATSCPNNQENDKTDKETY